MDYKLKNKTNGTIQLTNLHGKILATYTPVPNDPGAYTPAFPKNTPPELQEALITAFSELLAHPSADLQDPPTDPQDPQDLPEVLTRPLAMPPPHPVLGTTDIAYMSAAAELMPDTAFHNLYHHRQEELRERLGTEPTLEKFFLRLQP